MTDLIPDYSSGMIAFFSYYGSKRRTARHYPVPRHGVIVEPFAGSASYSMEYPDREVILVEKDPKIASLWKWLVNAEEDEILSLPDVEPGQRWENLPCRKEAQDLIRLRVSMGRDLQGVVLPSFFKWKDTSSRWKPSIQKTLAAQLCRIRHWKIIEGDYSESPDIEATWFVDPPYQDPKVNNSHYGPSVVNHSDVAEFCLGRKGQVIACDRIGSTWLPFRPFMMTSVVSGGGRNPPKQYGQMTLNHPFLTCLKAVKNDSR